MSKVQVSTLHRSPADTDEATRVEHVYRRYRDGVYRLALRFGDVSWAEDVTQDVFVTLCRHISRLDDDDDMMGWLYRVTQNRCLTRLRRRAVRNAPGVRWLLGDRQPKPADPEQVALHRQGLRRAFTVVDRLPPAQRVAFCMYHLDGMELAEIGEILGFSKSYVCKLVKRAGASIREAGWELGSG